MKITVTVFKKETSSAEITVELQEGESQGQARDRVLEACQDEGYKSLFSPVQQVKPEYDDYEVKFVSDDALLSACDDEDEAAEYEVVGESVALTNAGLLVHATLAQAKKAAQEIDASYAGAYFARLLKLNPCIDSFDVELEVEMQYNDEGGMSRMVTAKASNLWSTADTDMSCEIFTKQQYKDGAAEALMNDHLNDESESLYDGFTADPQSTETVRFQVSRSKISHLLDPTVVSGKEAFAVLFPDHTEKVAR